MRDVRLQFDVKDCKGLLVGTSFNPPPGTKEKGEREKKKKKKKKRKKRLPRLGSQM